MMTLAGFSVAILAATYFCHAAHAVSATPLRFVAIKTAGGVDAGNWHQVGQGAPAAAGLRAELAQHAIGLVQQQGGHGGGRWTASFSLAPAPEIDHPDGNQQQAQIHRNGGQNHC